MKEAFSTKEKAKRQDFVSTAKKALAEGIAIPDDDPNEKVLLSDAFKALEMDIMRGDVLKTKQRIDGRELMPKNNDLQSRPRKATGATPGTTPRRKDLGRPRGRARTPPAGSRYGASWPRKALSSPPATAARRPTPLASRAEGTLELDSIPTGAIVTVADQSWAQRPRVPGSRAARRFISSSTARASSSTRMTSRSARQDRGRPPAPLAGARDVARRDHPSGRGGDARRSNPRNLPLDQDGRHGQGCRARDHQDRLRADQAQGQPAGRRTDQRGARAQGAPEVWASCSSS